MLYNGEPMTPSPMNSIIAFFLVFTSTLSLAQQSTYSVEEERMLQYVNNQCAYALKYDSLKMIPPALDSCWRFLDKYPRSFARGGVFSYMFEMSSVITSDTTILFPRVDSVLRYDQLPVTRFSIAEKLIERNINRKRGRELLWDAYPHLSAAYHRFKANVLLARFALEDGNSSAAKTFFKQALSEDSTRVEGWYEYASYLKVTEQLSELAVVQGKLRAMEEQDRLNYEVHSRNSPYINKNFSDYTPQDINGSPIDFRQFLGRPVIAQCFNFWCPQMKEYPVLKQIGKEFPNAKIVLINAGETPEELRTKYLTQPQYRFLKNYTIVFTDSSISWGLFGGTVGMGTLLLIDKSGHVRADYHGYSKELEQLLRSKLRKLNHERH